MALLIASGITETPSAEFTLADGQGCMLNLTAPAGAVRVPQGARASVQFKTSDGVFLNAGQIVADNPAQLLAGPGTYRVVRHALGSPFGVDKS